MDEIKTEKAPDAIGPYSQAVKTNGFVFCSGQIALKPDGTLMKGNIRKQTIRVMENLKSVLEASGSGFEKVVKTTVYLADIDDFIDVNEVYGSYFKGDIKPARALVEVSGLPKGVKIEIECVAEV
ncbi:deaminase [Candidatus Peregrinibacteria bacterium]|nr:deaminase [Candidatus Peregrinibacteria bacterium]